MFSSQRWVERCGLRTGGGEGGLQHGWGIPGEIRAWETRDVTHVHRLSCQTGGGRLSPTPWLTRTAATWRTSHTREPVIFLNLSFISSRIHSMLMFKFFWLWFYGSLRKVRVELSDGVVTVCVSLMTWTRVRPSRSPQSPLPAPCPRSQLPLGRGRVSRGQSGSWGLWSPEYPWWRTRRGSWPGRPNSFHLCWNLQRIWNQFLRKNWRLQQRKLLWKQFPMNPRRAQASKSRFLLSSLSLQVWDRVRKWLRVKMRIPLFTFQGM